jgi:4-hydroxythreonine-4-phosphate dehydrogenase
MSKSTMAPAPLYVTMGDPVGIGPETIAKAHALGALDDCVVVGDPDVMARAAACVGAASMPRVLVPDGGMPSGLLQLPWGQVSADAGEAAARAVIWAAQAALHGTCAGVVTAPLNKLALSAAGHEWPGHTELLQSLAASHVGRSVPVRMMLANDELKVVLVTIHVSLREAVAAISQATVLDTIRMTHAALLHGSAHEPPPRIAVAGLNPHAGEGGRFGDEEIRHIAPAVALAQQEGIDAQGPFAPDTVFMRARQGAFDVVVAMTHDQGLIPVKYLGVEHGVNVTLGLPFVRTSPDHGTAFDIAGQGMADPASLIAAVSMARQMAGQKGLQKALQKAR